MPKSHSCSGAKTIASAQHTTGNNSENNVMLPYRLIIVALTKKWHCSRFRSQCPFSCLLTVFAVTLTLGVHHSGRQSEFRQDNLLHNNPNGDYCPERKKIIHRHPLSSWLQPEASFPWFPPEQPFPSSAPTASSPLLPFFQQQGSRSPPQRRLICLPSVQHSR